MRTHTHCTGETLHTYNQNAKASKSAQGGNNGDTTRPKTTQKINQSKYIHKQFRAHHRCVSSLSCCWLNAITATASILHVHVCMRACLHSCHTRQGKLANSLGVEDGPEQGKDGDLSRSDLHGREVGQVVLEASLALLARTPERVGIAHKQENQC